ncbi:SulP family inorganic anion transporter [Paracoccus albus]|uniref:SulP family inorganic anion transporter n=1 Tax=Paracoccus albus TaxID=3017784 RepID=UPI0022F037C8|nr:SulP family inorganic anion transporter [Paracoccus albus]WBU59265.1 SulP family inorganic anion transporter [Paracoccus albus]
MPDAKAALTSHLRDLFGRPEWFARVGPQTLRADLFAGLTGATLVLPQGIAFAAIAGLPPEYGFYTAMVTATVAALAGSSWHAVSGPTTAISALVFGALSGMLAPGSPEFIAAAITLAVLVGMIQLAMGLARMGALVDFVSHSVMTGFVTGAAILIALSQIDKALGIELPRPEDLGGFASGLFHNLSETSWRAALVAGSALGTALLIRQFLPRWPNYLIAMALATLVSVVLGGAGSGIETIGAIDGVIPTFAFPDLSLDTISELSSAAVAIALVGLLEAMSVARALAIRSGQMIDGNREFVGQGLSNVGGGFFQCYPGSASFTRSGVNYDSGAATPLAAIFASVFLLLILLLVAPLFAYVPIPAMAGVIILVAARLIDFREIRHILSTSPEEAFIAGVTFLSALFIDLEFAIYAGVLLSLALFLKKTSQPFVGVGAPDPSTPTRVFKNAAENGLAECPQLMFARLDGPLYFGSVEHVRRIFRRFEIERKAQKHMIFVVKGVGEIDMPGADLLIEEAARRHRRGGSFHLQTKTPRTISKLARFKVMKALTREHIHLSKRDAIAEIIPLLDPKICETCPHRIFSECPPAPSGTEGDVP